MKAIITRTSSQHDSIEAKTANDILVVFTCLDKFKLDDEVEFIDFVLDGEIEIINHSRGTKSLIAIKSDNVHDLRLPMAHGKSRTPSMGRLKNA